MSMMIPYSFRRNSIANPMRLFDDDFFHPFFSPAAMQESFRVSVRDAGENFELEAELPGVPRESLTIDVSDGMLTIGAEWSSHTDSADGYVLNERRYGKMQRSFSIDGIDENAITAAYTDGILKLTLPKKAEVSNTRKIDIQ